MHHLKLTLLISSFVIPFILSVSVLLNTKKEFPKQVMAFALFNAFYVFLANYFYFQKLYSTYSSLHSLHISTVLWLFPSVYLYVKSIVGEKKNFKKELLHLVPGALFGITSAILFYGILDQNERVYYLTNYRTGIEFRSAGLKAVYIFRSIDVFAIIAQVIFYSIVFMKIPAKYHRQLREEYSNIENFSINWLKWFNVSFVTIGLLCIAFYVFNPMSEENSLFLVFFLFTISAFIWVIGIWSFKQQKPQLIPQAQPLILVNNQDTTSSDDKLTETLIQYFETEKPFLNSDLSLTSVCKNIGTNRTYLSGIINQKFGMNFNSFVNQYRVNYIQEYLKEHPDTSKEELVLIGGFGSISSLKRAVSKANGDNS